MTYWIGGCRITKAKCEDCENCANIKEYGSEDIGRYVIYCYSHKVIMHSDPYALECADFEPINPEWYREFED